MKLLCDTIVRCRSTQTGGGRNIKSTIALGQYPPAGQQNVPAATNVFIIIFTAVNKTGTRYKLTKNIHRVFTKFVNEGKATISLLQPDHDILIHTGDSLQLKCFLQKMRIALDGKADQNRVGLSSLAATAIPQTAHPITKMVIQRRSDYPVRGLPRTLKTLTVSTFLLDSVYIFFI